MQYKSTCPVHGFKGTLTKGNYPSVLTNLSHILFLFIEDTLFWLCKHLLYTKSKLNEKKKTNCHQTVRTSLKLALKFVAS